MSPLRALILVVPLGLAFACGDDSETAGPIGNAGGAGGAGGTSGLDGSMCWPGSETCSGACTDLLKDPVNCGSCGNACPSGQVCSVGACGLGCGGGTSACGELCVNLNDDPANCGSCGNICDLDQLCAGGSCVGQCPGALTPCLGGCVDLQTNGQHCGACGTQCPSGGCSGGQCHCEDGVKNGTETDIDCGGGCLPCNEGKSCGSPSDCASGLTCMNGTCWPVPPLGDLVGFWRLEGNAQDSSGNGNNGTVYGATATAGKVGQGYQIGAGACIGVPDSSSLDMVGSTGLSMLAWIKNAGGCATDHGIVMNKENTYELGVECLSNVAREAIQLSDNSWFWSGTGAVSTGTWRHIAITWDGSTVRHYVDGAEVYTRALSGSFADRATGFGIGCRSVPPDGSAPGGAFFVGVIDEVFVYKRGLTMGEIYSYYQVTK